MSGCMNSCGQHMSASIGLHGSSIRVGEKVAPAMQIVLGGGVDENGIGTVGDKIVKLPTKKMPAALRLILDDFKNNSNAGEQFNDYYRRQGKNYFYTLLKPTADTTKFVEDDYFDYGSEEYFTPEVGVGECAGVMYDMIGTIIKDSTTKRIEATDALTNERFSEAIYYAYTGFVIAAKALLLGKDVECNTQIKIVQDFDKTFVETNEFPVEGGFENLVLSINQNEPTFEFAKTYVSRFNEFLNRAISYREKSLEGGDKMVVESNYKA
jgi:sulfite reductase (ferredoxin)